MELIVKPKSKSRLKAALKDDGAPVGWKRRQKKPKDGASEEQKDGVSEASPNPATRNAKRGMRKRREPP